MPEELQERIHPSQDEVFSTVVAEANITDRDLALYLATQERNPLLFAGSLIRGINDPASTDQDRAEHLSMYLALVGDETQSLKDADLQKVRRVVKAGLFAMFLRSDVPDSWKDAFQVEVSDSVGAAGYQELMRHHEALTARFD